MQQDAVDCATQVPARRCIGKTFLERSVCEDPPLAPASRDTGHLPAPASQALYFISIYEIRDLLWL